MPGYRTLPNGSHEFTIKRVKLLPKPIRLYFENYDEGVAYAARLEEMLDRGIIPDEFQEAPKFMFIGDVIREYIKATSLKYSDKKLVNILYARIGTTPLKSVNYQWVECWVQRLKQEDNLAPGTIRHHVGALARCFDWASNKGIAPLAINPVRLLPKSYSQYNEHDVEQAKALGGVKREDNERDRRLKPAATGPDGTVTDPGEEVRIRRFMHDNPKPEGKERGLDMPRQGALILMFELALETAMRMSEIYTLTLDQIDISRRTIFLDRTKNGSKRQVPTSSRAIAAIEQYKRWVEAGEMKMTGYDYPEGRVFPHWDGSLDQKDRHAISAKLSNQFVRIFRRAGCEDLGFHDLRHEAISRLFERTSLSDAQIMKISGHISTEMLLRYANLRASDLADYLG